MMIIIVHHCITLLHNLKMKCVHSIEFW